jgi:hypothetical protein
MSNVTDPLATLGEFVSLCTEQKMTFMLVTRDADGYLHMSANDNRLVGCLDASNTTCRRLAPQILTDQFHEDLRRETESLGAESCEPQSSREVLG